jgi:L-aspartate oxidase
MKEKTDFLLIGSGIAGLSIAVQLANYGSVIIITKKKDKESNTNYAQGGIASVIAKTDSFDSHVRDTVTTGAGLCHKEAVKHMVSKGPRAIKQLIEVGVHFSHDNVGNLELGLEGGHSKNRIVHAKDYTGQEIEQALLRRVKNNPNIQMLENHIAIDLITEHQTHNRDFSKGIHCLGAYILDIKNNRVKTILASTTILATGGCGQVYLHTSNPAIATGDGIAMAYRAGAKIANLEFMQFHPTILFHQNAGSLLISEAVRGFGAILIDRSGNAFMKEYHNKGELAPRDVVARAIDSEMKKSGEHCVYLDLRNKNADAIKSRFPIIYSKCIELKIDITSEPIPVVPAAHYMCGGVVVDMSGRTSIDRLYACGEVAFTGVHGANRLASNSLLEAVVFSNSVVNALKKQSKEIPTAAEEVLPWNAEGTFNRDEWVYIVHDKHVIQSVMWDYVGIVRSDFRLARAWRRIEVIAAEVEEFYKKTIVNNDLIELRNIATIATLIIQCAMNRKESRGLHFNTDYLARDDKFWQHDTLISKPVF